MVVTPAPPTLPRSHQGQVGRPDRHRRARTAMFLQANPTSKVGPRPGLYTLTRPTGTGRPPIPHPAISSAGRQLELGDVGPVSG